MQMPRIIIIIIAIVVAGIATVCKRVLLRLKWLELEYGSLLMEAIVVFKTD